MFLNNFSTNCNCISYMNFIWLAANKSIPRIYDFGMTFVIHFSPLMLKPPVQHMGDTFQILTDLDYLTNHSSMKLSSFLQIQRNIFTTTGIFTRVEYLRINESYHRNFRISQLIPWSFLPTRFFIIT